MCPLPDPSSSSEVRGCCDPHVSGNEKCFVVTFLKFLFRVGEPRRLKAQLQRTEISRWCTLCFRQQIQGEQSFSTSALLPFWTG